MNIVSEKIIRFNLLRSSFALCAELTTQNLSIAARQCKNDNNKREESEKKNRKHKNGEKRERIHNKHSMN